MERIPLTITVKCTDNPSCIYSGTEMPIEIIVQNNGSYPIGFPQAYIQARGPAMKLIDTITGAQKTLKIGLANHDLMAQFTTLEPNNSLTMTSVIRASELTSLRKEYVNLVAEIGITINVKVPSTDEPVKYQGRGQVKIIGKDTIERDQHHHVKK